MCSFGSCQTRFEFLSQFRKVRNAFECFVTQVQTRLPKTKCVWPMKINMICTVYHPFCLTMRTTFLFNVNWKISLWWIISMFLRLCCVETLLSVITNPLNQSHVSQLIWPGNIIHKTCYFLIDGMPLVKSSAPPAMHHVFERPYAYITREVFHYHMTLMSASTMVSHGVSWCLMVPDGACVSVDFVAIYE